MTTTELEVHVSGASQHQDCNRLYWLLNRDDGMYTLRFPASALRLGSLIHDALDRYYYRGRLMQDAFKEAHEAQMQAMIARVPGGVLWDEEKEDIQKQVRLGAGMLHGYQEWIGHSLGQDLNDDQLVWHDVERAFHLEYEGVKMAGRWDGIVEHRVTGDWYIVEHKTARSIDEAEKGIPWDPQPYFYVWAASHILDVPISGVLYNFLGKSDIYNIPLLKNGLPSKAKGTLTTYDAYKETLERCIKDFSENERDNVFDDYKDVLERLLVDAPEVFKRIMFLVSPTLMEATRRQMIVEAHKMRQTLIDGPLAQPSKSRFRCGRCPVRNICLAIDSGANWEEVADSELCPNMRENSES